MNYAASSSSAHAGFLVHLYRETDRRGTTLYGLGRLVDGRTFGIVERRLTPHVFIRAGDISKASGLISRCGAHWRRICMQTMDSQPVVEVCCTAETTRRRLVEDLEDASVQTYEGDVSVARAYRMDRALRGPLVLKGKSQPGERVDCVFVNPEVTPGTDMPALTLTSLHIETTPDHDTITAVAIVTATHPATTRTHCVHVLTRTAITGDPEATTHNREQDLLAAVRQHLLAADPDIIVGWNVAGFELPVMEARFRANDLAFDIGRAVTPARCPKNQRFNHCSAFVPGRQVIDGMHLARHTPRRFDDLRLETVARSVLEHGPTPVSDEKPSMPAAIEALRRSDPAAFADCCREDACLVLDILEQERLLALTLRRSILTGLPLQRAWGSVAAFDMLYISELHRQQRVAPTARPGRSFGKPAPGGLVLPPEPGCYGTVFVFDFKSLYPSIMRTFNIDPLSLRLARNSAPNTVITAPNGASFARQPGILPALLDELWEEREAAKRLGDDLTSRTLKLVMNSFYGVLGTTACRFGAGELAGAITSFGHLMLRWTRDYFIQQGCRVLYGDTDSLFVDPSLSPDCLPEQARRIAADLARQTNAALAAYIDKTYGVTSRLELEFEKHYLRLLLPEARGGEGRGRAKGYAGRLACADGTAELDIVGMEAVRHDWTDMAHDLQRKLIDLLFDETPARIIETVVANWIRDLNHGLMDAHLVYRKRLRKPIGSYTAAIPPHVRAAAQLENPSGMIRYVITTRGAQPESGQTAPIDYAHYVRSQVKPLVDMIAPFTGIDVESALGGTPRLL